MIMIGVSKITNEVKEIRSFLDESYACSIGHRYSSSDSNAQLPWGRILVEKFCDRIIPHISGNNEKVEKAVSNIMVAIKNAISFGNGTLIVDSNGNTRVGIPEASIAEIDAFGNISYFEEHVNAEDKNQIFTVFGIDGRLFYMDKDEDGNDILVETGSSYFSIFYKDDGAAPHGRSRISPAIRNSIMEASKNKMRAVEAANFRTFPQWVINGIWDGIDPSVEKGVGKMLAGISQVVGIPENPDHGGKVSIEEFSAADFTSYQQQHDILAKEVAAAGNLNPSELGVTAAQPSSADALYAAKEDLVLEITAFERKIHHTIQAAIDDIAKKSETEKVVLSWQEPATPSKTAQADAFVKLASVLPQLKYSKKALAWAGLPSGLIEDIANEIEDLPATLEE